MFCQTVFRDNLFMIPVEFPPNIVRNLIYFLGARAQMETWNNNVIQTSLNYVLTPTEFFLRKVYRQTGKRSRNRNFSVESSWKGLKTDKDESLFEIKLPQIEIEILPFSVEPFQNQLVFSLFSNFYMKTIRNEL